MTAHHDRRPRLSVVDQLMVEAQQRAKRVFGFASEIRENPPLWYEPLERRVLGAMIGEYGVLRLCDEVELDDFADFRHRAVFAAIRQLQQLQHDVDPVTVVDGLERTDLQDEKHVSQQVDLIWLVDLALDSAQYLPAIAGTLLLERDLWHLRTLADRRRSL